jgi:hypothetical protein
MNKYTRIRDTRSEGGVRLSCCIQADSAEEADAIFEERWRQKLLAPAEGLPVRTTAEIQREAMRPGALALKRARGMAA